MFLCNSKLLSKYFKGLTIYISNQITLHADSISSSFQMRKMLFYFVGNITATNYFADSTK